MEADFEDKDAHYEKRKKEIIGMNMGQSYIQIDKFNISYGQTQIFATALKLTMHRFMSLTIRFDNNMEEFDY